MRIAYLINHDISKNDGVTKKILNQISEWKKIGNEVVVFCNTINSGDSILDAKQYQAENFIKSRLKVNTKLLSDLTQFDPSLVYFRYDTWSRTFHEIQKRYKIVTELNTNDLGEYFLLLKKERNIKSLLRFLTYYFLRSKILRNVDGIVSVTNEISNLPSVSKFNKKSISIPNSIDLIKYNIIKNKDKRRIGLFFIGTPNQPWHGVDIIEEIAKELPEFDIHIVGINNESHENIFYHGYLEKQEYLKVLEKCNICIGSLALFRNNMSEACPLKVREYLAYGFPIIIGYKESAFVDLQNFPAWALKIDSNNVNVNEIKEFVLQNYNTIVKREEIGFISTLKLEKQRVEFFKTFV